MHNILVGSVSFASPGKALHNPSTFQEITVITESAANFEFHVCFFFFLLSQGNANAALAFTLALFWRLLVQPQRPPEPAAAPPPVHAIFRPHHPFALSLSLAQ